MENKQGGVAEKFILISLMLSPLFIINWLHNTRMSVRGEYLLLFQTLVMLYLALSQKNRFTGLFLFWSVVSFYIFKFQGIFYLSMVFFGNLLFYIIYQNVKNIDLALKAISISVFIVIASMVAQVIGVLPLTIGNFTIGVPLRSDNLNLIYNGVTGLLAQGNITGAYLAMCLPIFFVYFRSALWLVVIAIIMTKCNGAIISGSIGTVFYFLFRPNARVKKTVTITLICLLLVIGFLLFDGPDYKTRLFAAKQILIKTTGWKIITGHGLGSFAGLRMLGAPTGNPMTDWMKQAHNEYLQVYYELGLIGLGLILLFLGSLFSRFTKTLKTDINVAIMSSVVVIVVISAFSFNFHHALTAMIGLTLLVVCDKTLKKEELV